VSEIDLAKLPDSPKLHRAAVLSQEAIEMTEAWLSSGAGVVQKNVGQIAVAYEFRLAPVEVRLVLGDCFQNTRAALDHEVYALSAKRHGKVWADQADTAFPIAKTEQSFRSRGEQQIRGLSDAAKQLVEQLQPYRDPRHPLAKSLELVHYVARIDRHRLLSLSAAQPQSFELNQTTMRANLTVSLHFVMDERFGGTDALAASRACIVAVAWTIDHLREADAASS
jgi:hypothetical protein